MENPMTQPVFQAYAVSVCALAITLFGLGAHTAKTRSERKIVVNSEDAGINGGAALGDVDHPDVQRIKRAHTNLIESAVPFFAVGLVYCLTSPNVALARTLFGAFVLTRVFHAVFYLGAKQPFRTIAFGVGTLVSLVMIVQVLRAVVSTMQ